MGTWWQTGLASGALALLVCAGCMGLKGGAAEGRPGSVQCYVSPLGNDAWSGSLAAPNRAATDGPFATLARARDELRALRAQGLLRYGATVWIRGGTYRLAEPLTLTPTDSGTPEGPVSYVAYPNEQPLLSGGRLITGWQPWQGQISYASLPEVKAGSWTFRSLFANGERRVRARYPNVDPTDPRRKGFLYVRRGLERHTVGSLHNLGDTLDYEITVPAAGDYAVWLRYTMEAYQGLADMSGRTSLAVDGGKPTPLLNLKHRLHWRNDQGGGEGWKHAEHGTVELSAIPATLEREAQTLRAAGFAQFDADDDEEEDEDEDEDEEEESKTKKRPREEEEDERKKTKKLRPVLSLSLSPQTDEQTNKSPTSERG